MTNKAMRLICLLAAVLLATAQMGLRTVLIVSLSLIYVQGALAQTPAASTGQRTGLQQIADKTSMEAWTALRAGQFDDANYRFNQALLLDRSNALALWGIAVIHAQKEEFEESRKSFEKAEPSLSNDVNFNVDYARTLGYAGIAAHNETMVINAFERFKKVYEIAPEHRVNLENWAVILFNTGNYAEAWEKIKLAEKTPSGKNINKKFVDALQSKMPRP
ncbi:MAG: tetratricopeptide repeat protein [Rhodocyclaceae bacterium]|nr:tetratricopeptide repeat protein [Rhodocyclaceae bacterium]